MAYMILIIHTHHDYEDPAWRRYNEAFRDKAAVTGNCRWAALDPDLYNRICSGRGRVVPFRGGPSRSFSDVSTSLPNRENTKDLASSSVSRGKRSNICYDWNKDNCAYNPCKYRHTCPECSGHHPLTQCKGLQDDPQRRSGHTGARPHS